MLRGENRDHEIFTRRIRHIAARVVEGGHAHGRASEIHTAKNATLHRSRWTREQDAAAGGPLRHGSVFFGSIGRFVPEAPALLSGAALEGAARAGLAAPAATLADVERLQIERVLSEEGGQVAVAARRLGISRSTLYNKIQKYGLMSNF